MNTAGPTETRSARSDLALPVLRHLSRWLPEGRWKNRLRARLLAHRAALPRELMVGRGETAIQVGMWSRRNLARLASCVGSSGRVILIEADRRAARDMASLIAERGLANVTLVNKGAANRAGTRSFLQGTLPGYSRLEGTDARMASEVGASPFEGAERIAVDTVDRIALELGVSRADYVEISVNGLELEVLEGMERMLGSTERLFLAGCALVKATGEPTNRRTAAFLRARGFRTTISRRYFAPSDRQLGLLDGHVFAWRE